MPPQIHPFTFDETVNSGDYVTVTCAATRGDIPINITWTLNGRRFDIFDQITTVSMNQRGNQLTIESAQAHHTGEYLCSARNLVGVAKYSSYLNVNGIVQSFNGLEYFNIICHFLSYQTFSLNSTS